MCARDAIISIEKLPLFDSIKYHCYSNGCRHKSASQYEIQCIVAQLVTVATYRVVWWPNDGMIVICDRYVLQQIHNLKDERNWAPFLVQFADTLH